MWFTAPAPATTRREGSSYPIRRPCSRSVAIAWTVKYPRHSSAAAGEPAAEVDRPAAVVLLARRRGGPGPPRSPRARRARAAAARGAARSRAGAAPRPRCPPATGARRSWGRWRARRPSSSSRPDRVEQPERELQLYEPPRLVLRADRGHAVRGRALQPRMPCRGGHAVRRLAHRRGDVERRRRRVGAAPTAPRSRRETRPGARTAGRRRAASRASSQSHSARAVSSPPPVSASVSNACSAPAGWLPGTRRSGSSPQPKPPSALRYASSAARTPAASPRPRSSSSRRRSSSAPWVVRKSVAACEIDHAPHGPPWPRPRLEDSGPAVDSGGPRVSEG